MSFIDAPACADTCPDVSPDGEDALRLTESVSSAVDTIVYYHPYATPADIACLSPTRLTTRPSRQAYASLSMLRLVQRKAINALSVAMKPKAKEDLKRLREVRVREYGPDVPPGLLGTMSPELWRARRGIFTQDPHERISTLVYTDRIGRYRGLALCPVSFGGGEADAMIHPQSLKTALYAQTPPLYTMDAVQEMSQCPDSHGMIASTDTFDYLCGLIGSPRSSPSLLRIAHLLGLRAIRNDIYSLAPFTGYYDLSHATMKDIGVGSHFWLMGGPDRQDVYSLHVREGHCRMVRGCADRAQPILAHLF